MLKIWTSTYDYKGKDKFDISVKLGNLAFSPTYDLDRNLKTEEYIFDKFKDLFTKRMRYSYKKYDKQWLDLLSKSEVTLVCNCKHEKQCHKYILANILVKCGATYMGER